MHWVKLPLRNDVTTCLADGYTSNKLEVLILLLGFLHQVLVDSVSIGLGLLLARPQYLVVRYTFIAIRILVDWMCRLDRIDASS